MDESQRIPGNIEAETWSLAIKVCQQAKLDSDQQEEFFPKLRVHLIQRRLDECQKFTDLEIQDWKENVRENFLNLAKKSREHAWRRVLFYKRCKYLRYVIVLSSSTLVAYLCPQQTIFLHLSDVLHSWSGWYHLFTFFAVAAVPIGLAVVASVKKLAFRHLIRLITAITVTLGFTLPIGLSFVALFWRWSGEITSPLDWMVGFVAIPICVCGLITAFIEVFYSRAQYHVHPLEKTLPVPLHRENADDIREQVEHELSRAAFKVCSASHMDEGAFRDKVAENIRNSLFDLWCRHLQEGNDSLAALNTILKNFGPLANAGDEDSRWMRILFYERHTASRYLAVIGIALIVLYIQLIAVEFPVQGDEWRWGLWNENVLNGTIIAFCVFAAKHSWLVKLRPFSMLFGLGVLWGIQRVFVDALNALITIHDDWSEGWAICGLLVVTPTLCLGLVSLLCCTVSECLRPVPASIVASIRRWDSQIREVFQRR